MSGTVLQHRNIIMNKTIVGEKNDEKKQGTVQDQRQLRLPIAT